VGIWVPAAALRIGGEGATMVMAVADGRLQERAVTTGRRSGDRVEITGGLSAGERIAAGGLEQLRDGQRVD
jgi:membrane fusion protein (multidrug efflux system)